MIIEEKVSEIVEEKDCEMSEANSEEATSEGQYIFRRELRTDRPLDPYDVKNIYRTDRDIKRAIHENTFDVAKTMHMDWTTKNIFWLCYK